MNKLISVNPDPGRGVAYVATTIEVDRGSYIVFIGCTGSEPTEVSADFKGKIVKVSPFTTPEGVISWVKDEHDRLSSLGGSIQYKVNKNADGSTGQLEKLLGEAGLPVKLPRGEIILR